MIRRPTRHPRGLPDVPSRRRLGLATLAVLWAVALVSVLIVAQQGTAFRQAASGRTSVARLRAYWAARAGLESQIAKLSINTLTPDPNSAFTVRDDLAAAARFEFPSSSFVVQHVDDNGQLVDGPLDAHSRINVNTLSAEDLLGLDSMDEGTAANIEAWTQGEDATGATSTSSGAYESLRYPYTPRAAPLRSLKELELITGVTPELVRGEDVNQNNLLDPAEDDADLSFPPDNADSRLDAGWSRYITVVSELGSYAASGVKRLDLRTAAATEIATRLKVDSSQAQIISEHAAAGGELADFVRSELRTLATSTTGVRNLDGSSGAGSVASLTRDQLRTLLDEATMGEAETRPRQGRININTVSRQTLERFTRIDPTLADTLITERDARSGGFVSLADLLDIPGMDNQQLADLMDVLDVHSSVFVVTSRGRDTASGIEVEIVATVDRSTIPVVIRDLIVR